jgi:glycosyltransferase involved in cell wall biosynthesis
MTASSVRANSVSVVIPAYNAGDNLTRCLLALGQSSLAPLETIVVDDGSTDDTRERALGFGIRVIETGGRRGPGFARNLGSKYASGDILFFLDADVCVQPDTVKRIQQCFAPDASLDAVIGSYDRFPACWNFLSQYRNLMHTYVHQSGNVRASTFWTGCGAIRRDVFVLHGGFDESYTRPAIEDIELGYRLVLGGRKIMLDRQLQVTHLKRWSLWNIVKTDILDRGIPWTELILRRRFMPNDLNLKLSQRFSVTVAFLVMALTGLLVAEERVAGLIPLLAIVFLMLAGWWSEIRNLVRPRISVALLSCFVAVLAGAAYWHRMFPLVVVLLLSPVFILTMRPSYKRDKTPAWSYVLSALYIVGSLCVALASIPDHPLLVAWISLIVLLGVLNAGFYRFLMRERRILFMLAAIPLHSFHHFYNGFSFIIGLCRHGWTVLTQSGVRHFEPEMQQAHSTLAGLPGEDGPE